MYTVIKQVSSKTFGSINWYKLLGPSGMSFQAYLSLDEANNICDKLNLEKRLTNEEKAIIRAKAEQKRLQKIVDKL